MSQNQIKWLATILMLVDHIGFLLEAEPMRIIGRLSFPIFAGIFAPNWKRRENASTKPLITRLMLFGILAQIPYILLFMNLNLNILISWAVAGITFSQIHKSSKKILIPHSAGSTIVREFFQLRWHSSSREKIIFTARSAKELENPQSFLRQIGNVLDTINCQ